MLAALVLPPEAEALELDLLLRPQASRIIAALPSRLSAAPCERSQRSRVNGRDPDLGAALRAAAPCCRERSARAAPESPAGGALPPPSRTATCARRGCRVR